MAVNGPGVVTLENCIPTGRVSLQNAASGQLSTRDWTWSVNGAVDMPQILDNGSVLPNGVFDPRNAVVGYDGSLFINTGDGAGTELVQVTRFSIDFDIGTVPFAPLKLLRVQQRIVNVSITLTFNEYILNDVQMAASILMPLMRVSAWTKVNGTDTPLSDPMLSFHGILDPALAA